MNDFFYSQINKIDHKYLILSLNAMSLMLRVTIDKYFFAQLKLTTNKIKLDPKSKLQTNFS